MKEDRRITLRVFGEFTDSEIAKMVEFLPESGITAWTNGWMISKEDNRKSEVYTIWKKGHFVESEN